MLKITKTRINNTTRRVKLLDVKKKKRNMLGNEGRTSVANSTGLVSRVI